MGAYRSKPDTEQHTIHSHYDNYKYAVSQMCGTFTNNQGWRFYMEDAYIAIAPFTHKNFGLFGVFDGHGGKKLFRSRC